MFGCVICRTIADAYKPCDGCYIDDASDLLLEHQGSEALRKEEWRNEIHLEHAAKCLYLYGLCRRDKADSSVVHENVGASPAGSHCFHGARHRSFIGDISDELLCICALRANGSQGRDAGSEIHQGKRVACRCKDLCCTTPNALGR